MNYGEHRLYGKPFPYEEKENIRMPLVVRGPGITAGSRSHHLVGDVDFAPTFLEIAGGVPPPFLDGRSFAGILTGTDPPPEKWRSAYFLTSGLWDAVRLQAATYIEFRSGGREFYDLTTHPWQLQNTYASLDPGRRKELSDLVRAFATCAGASCREAEQRLSLPARTVDLTASVSRHGSPGPPDDLTVHWAQTAGPPGVAFADPASVSTAATFPGAGIYELTVRVTHDGETASDDVRVSVRSESRRALFVAGSPTLPSGDRAIRDRIVAAGFEVTVLDDDADLAGQDLRSSDLLVISSSVVPGKVGGTFKDAPVPIITWDGYLFDDLGLSTQSTGEVSARDHLTIVDPHHPLAAGMNGRQTVYTRAQTMSFGSPAGGARVVAAASVASSPALVFSHETGAALADGTMSPARRVALFPSYLGVSSLNANGLALVDAAISWAAGGG